MTQDNVNPIVATIAAQLGETKRVAIETIRRYVQVVGPETATATLTEALAVEAGGGMMTRDGSRRRTPGGVYFALVRERITREQWPKIFLTGRTTPVVQPPQPKAPPFRIEELPEVLEQLQQHYGEASTVKITVIGRPGQVVQRGDVVVIGLVSEKLPTMPKGLPAPPKQTKYVVLVARKQWTKVADAIKVADDLLIIEGYPAYEPRHAGITVYTTNITTKHQQQAKREAQQAQQAPE